MNQLVTTNNGGQPIYLDDIRWNDSAYRSAMAGMLAAFGTDFIISGCTSGEGTCNAGYIMLGGEILQVDTHTITGNYFSKVQTYDAAGSDEYQDTSTHNVYLKNRGVCNASSGNLNITQPLLLINLVLAQLRSQPETINIGYWNMNSTAELVIPITNLGVTNNFAGASSIKAIDVLIFSDNSESIFKLDYIDTTSFLNQGGYRITYDGLGGWNLHLYRANSGTFDSVSFESGTINRGLITIHK